MIQLLLSQVNHSIISSNIVPLILLLIVLSCIASVCASNPMTSLMFLILSFLNLSLLLLVMGLEFLSFLTLLIYVGSICILFIFVLMILNLKILILKNYIYYKMYFVSFFVFTIIMLIYLLINFEFSTYFVHFNTTNPYISWSHIFFSTSDLEVIGEVMFTKYIFHFVIAAIILFSVLIGSVSVVTQTKKVPLKLKYLKKRGVDLLNHDFNNITINKKN